MVKRHLWLLLPVLWLGQWLPLLAQETFPYNGVYDQRDGWYALTNATIIPKAGERLEKATLVMRDGKIVALGTNVTVPKGAVVIDLAGKYVYPSFIDPYSSYGLGGGERPEGARGGGGGMSRFLQPPQMVSDKPGAYAWNEALKPEYEASEHFTPNEKDAKAWREQGFGTVLTHQMDGISRGASSLVMLGDERAHEMMVTPKVAHHLSFRKGASSQDYPASLMGAIALLRQTYLDGQWYAKQNKEINLSLAAWNDVQSLPQVFEVDSWQDLLRAVKLGKEFGKTYIIRGAGDEYQRLDAVKAGGAGLILPLKFPEAYDVSNPYDAGLISLDQMRHWELAPTNPAKVAAAGIAMALTANGLEKPADFWPALRKAMQNGLSESDALRALTETPARLLNAADQVGTLAVGKFANLIVTSGPLSDKEMTVYQNWVKGKPYEIKPVDKQDLRGTYTLTAGSQTYTVQLQGKADQPDMMLLAEDTTKLKYELKDGLLSLAFKPRGEKGMIRLSGLVQGKEWTGRGQDAQGEWITWKATYQEPTTDAADLKKAEDKAPDYAAKVTYPMLGYGFSEVPKAATYLIRNATVWTNEAQGRLENTDVLIRDGKIAQVGRGLSAGGATVIDGTGKHLTAGIIDEHTHIAASRGINEGTQASSAEVRIGDVVDATDIDIYRQLAGGVTTAQILHGSSNPIGGQSAIIKLRWGYLPDQMIFDAAPPFIKFALGENVKQASRPVDGTRFPQTRMGVEQVYASYFNRAREYGELKRSGQPYRKDLELEALLEILEGKRHITCHSYQQGEINMLMALSDKLGFKINTFTHILEGYKVADKMAQRNIAGSSFSDWWAYKFEVIEAIPYNGALMHGEGVLTAFNSDDAEMARRLNQEAAKAVLFGGVSEEEALKFVTLNPAKMLHIDHRVGSIKVGKDGDVVLWSDHPLSIYARADMTFIDGIKFYDRQMDEQQRLAIRAERNALIQKMLAEKEKGGPTQAARGRRTMHYHCDSVEDEGR